MFKKIAGLFRKQPVVVTGTGKLQEGHSKVVHIGDVLAGTGHQVLFTRLNGELMAIGAVCPHQGAQLDDGPLTDGKWVLCPLHMYHFDPKTGAERSHQCGASPPYKVREVGDDCEIWL